MRIRKIHWKILVGFFALLYICVFGATARAAFPSDMDKKPLTAVPLASDISVYEDPAMTRKKMEISGGSIEFTARDVSDDQKALYGTFEVGGEKKEGWIPSSVFSAMRNSGMSMPL